MRQILTKIRNRKLVVLGLAIAIICCMSITAYATSYSFPQLELKGNGSNQVLLQKNFYGSNIRCGYSTSTSYIRGYVIGQEYLLTIEKKGWWFWQWDTVASKKCYWGDTVSLAAYNVGDGEYRFVVTTPQQAPDGIYVNDFTATSWN